MTFGIECGTVYKDKLTFVYKEIHVVLGFVNNVEIIKGKRILAGTGLSLCMSKLQRVRPVPNSQQSSISMLLF